MRNQDADEAMKDAETVAFARRAKVTTHNHTSSHALNPVHKVEEDRRFTLASFAGASDVRRQ